MEFQKIDSDVFNRTVQKSSFWEFKGQEEFIDEWFLMSSPVPVIMVSVTYLLFVLKIGPDYMKKRPAYNLNLLLLLYNFVQVAISTYLMTFGLRILWPQGLVRLNCRLSKEDTFLIATGMYYYFSAKISELLDTVFFVLRKKNSQVTFLHVYHHTLMMLASWFALKYEPTYTTIFLGTINSFVHMVMYTYYGLSTFPSISKFLWWKKYITKMQLVQFMAIILEVTTNYFFSSCKPSYLFLYLITLNAVLFIYLFTDFYVRAYLKNKKDKQDALNISEEEVRRHEKVQ